MSKSNEPTLRDLAHRLAVEMNGVTIPTETGWSVAAASTVVFMPEDLPVARVRVDGKLKGSTELTGHEDTDLRRIMAEVKR